jgi:hypothetical protein
MWLGALLDKAVIRVHFSSRKVTYLLGEMEMRFSKFFLVNGCAVVKHISFKSYQLFKKDV